MTGLHVTVPIACFRKGLAREYLETESLPPPATCYGFLLSFVGETDRRRHIGCRVTAGVVGSTSTSVVLRTVWRVKDKTSAQGSRTNARPDYQQLLTGGNRDSPFIELIVWLDSSEEFDGRETLEHRVSIALDPKRRATITRFGGLSIGESTHLIDSIVMLNAARSANSRLEKVRVFELRDEGSLTLPVWVDHVGSRTRYATGELVARSWGHTPVADRLPRIKPD